MKIVSIKPFNSEAIDENVLAKNEPLSEMKREILKNQNSKFSMKTCRVGEKLFSLTISKVKYSNNIVNIKELIMEDLILKEI